MMERLGHWLATTSPWKPVSSAEARERVEVIEERVDGLEVRVDVLESERRDKRKDVPK